MIAPPSPATPLTAVRVGRTDLGAGRVSVDEDAVTIAFAGEGARPLRFRLDTLDSVHRTGNDVELTLRDGTRITAATADSAALRDDIISRCRTIPELTRTLRSFGSSRGRRGSRDSAGSEQQRFFAPLIDARRGAQGVSSMGAIAAFNATRLLTAFDETLRAFAADRHVQAGPARRALQAELEDVTEPMFDALRALRHAADAATAAPEDLRAWRAWSDALSTVFERADRVWVALDAALDSPLIGP